MSRRLTQTTRRISIRISKFYRQFSILGGKEGWWSRYVETPHGVTTRFHYSGSYPRVSLLIRIGSYPMWCFTRFH